MDKAESERVGTASDSEVCSFDAIFYGTEGASSASTCDFCFLGHTGCACELDLGHGLRAALEADNDFQTWCTDHAASLEFNNGSAPQSPAGSETAETDSPPYDTNNNIWSDDAWTLGVIANQEALPLGAAYDGNNNNAWSDEEVTPWRLNVIANQDAMPGANPEAWKKNKYRLLTLKLDVGLALAENIFISPLNYNKGNNKKPVQKGASDLELQLELTDENEKPLVPCSECRNKGLVDITAASQRLAVKRDGIIDLKARIQCLPAYHGVKNFQLHLKIKNYMDEEIASLVITVPKVIASRSKQR